MTVDVDLVPTTVTIGPDDPTTVTPDGDAVAIVQVDRAPLIVTATVPIATIIRDPEPPTTVVETPAAAVSVVSIGTAGPPGPQGPQGPQGLPGSAPQAYTHDQQVPATTWTIDHNLGFRPGGVLVIDTLGEVVLGEITHPDANQTVLVFTAAFSGHAYLS